MYDVKVYREIPCRICGEPSRVVSRRLCAKHYSRFRRTGDPQGAKKRGNGELMKLALAALDTDEDMCIFIDERNKYNDLRHSGIRRALHVVVCELAHGPRPGEWVDACHNCGNAGCINPRHLRWDGRKGNSADREKHGTSHHGEKVNGAKLTERQVLDIYDRAVACAGRWTGTETYYDIASEYGICYDNVKQIKARKSWVNLLDQERRTL